MHKMYNKFTIKISYSCMWNIGSMLSFHNKNILNPKQNERKCALNGECLASNTIYHEDITTTHKHKFYFGVSETRFKQRHSNHFRHIKYIKYQHSTELAKYLLATKEQ